MRNVDEIFELIAEQVADISSHIAHEPITPRSMLSPLGMDSIGRAELIERMLEILNLKESRFHFHEANNLGELAELFEKKLRETEIRDSAITSDSVYMKDPMDGFPVEVRK
jgi:polyketide biosynthesis acyl carrier protein